MNARVRLMREYRLSNGRSTVGMGRDGQQKSINDGSFFEI